MLNPNNKLFRWGPISACPLFLHYTVETSFALMKRLFGYCYPETFVIYEGKKATWLLDYNDFIVQSRKFVEEVILNERSRTEYYGLWDKRTSKLIESFKKLRSLKLGDLTDDELNQEFEEFSKVYYDWWTVGMTVELITSSTEPDLGEKLKPYFPNEHPKEYNEAFSILTAPKELTFYREEQLGLLKVLELPVEKQAQSLREHQEKYYWIYNSYYEAKVLDENYFREELEKSKAADWETLLQEIKNYSKTITQEKSKIISKIKPSEEVLDLVDIAERFSKLQDTRKAYNFQADHYLELFVQEFAKRTNRNTSDLKLLLPEELKGVFRNSLDTEIEERKKSFISLCTDTEVTHISGDEAYNLARKYDKTSDIDQSVIHGTLASAGESYYFRGTAKIILSVDELDKLEEGDILVTPMTSPDFVIGMKKAGAIITDEGGLLCHAAIVSRELKKPCIVGTQIATKIIKDGDVIELHCGRGTVKVISHTQ